MSAIWMRMRSEFRTSRRSMLGLAILIAIAGVGVLAPLAGARRTDSAYDRFLAGSRVYEAETNEGVPGLGYNYTLDLDAVAALPEVVDHQIRRYFIVSYQTKTADFPPGAEAVVIHRALFEPGSSNAQILSGRLPDPNRVDEIAVGYGRAERDGVDVGDRITLRLLSPRLITEGLDFASVVEERSVRVVGIILLPGAVPPAVRYGQLYATPAFEDSYIDRAANGRAFYAKLKHGLADLPIYKSHLEQLAKGSVQFLTTNDQDAGVKRSIDVYVVALQAFAGLAVAAALLILTQTIARQVAIGSDDHPALRALGMTPSQLAAHAILRTTTSAVVGLAASIALAFGMSPLFPLGNARIVEPSPGLAFDVPVLVGGSALMLALIVAFAIPAALRAGRRARDPEYASQPEGQARPSAVATWLSGAGAPASIVAGIRLALERGRGRSATPVRSTVVASAVAIASIVTLLAFGASMRHLVETPRLYGWNWDSLAGNPYAPDLAAQVVPVLTDIAGIAEYSSGSTNLRVRVIRSGRDPVDMQALALSPGKGEVFPPMLEGRWPVDDDEVALGSTSIRALGVSPGDTVTITLGDKSMTATVVGRTVFPVVGDQYGGELGHGAGLTVDGLRRIVPNALVNIFPVRFEPGSGFNDLPDEAKALFFFQSDTELVLGARPEDLSNLSQATGAPLALTSLVGALGVATIAHALTTSVRRRRRDLAILKTIGFVRGQVRAAVVTQASALALLALALGIPLGVLAGRAAWLAFANNQGVVAEALLGSWPVFALIPATILVANLVAALPGRRAARLAPATILRTE